MTYDERLDELALSVLADPDSSDLDKDAARRRLERVPEDADVLLPEELDALEYLLARTQGAPYDEARLTAMVRVLVSGTPRTL